MYFTLILKKDFHEKNCINNTAINASVPVQQIS